MPVFFLPSKSRHQLDELPAEAGIYYVTAFWIVFYVGRSKNMRSRWRRHHKHNQFEMLGMFGRLHYRILPESKLQTYEKTEIARLDPPWNYKRAFGFWQLGALLLAVWGRVFCYIIFTILAIATGVYFIWFF